MSFPTFTIRQLLEAGVHFGHHTRRWNPKMETFIFGERNGIHIVDLQQTMPLLNQGLKALRDTTAKGGRVLFVGTKRNASEKLAETAIACGQYFVNHRWLGGMLTNWVTVSQSIRRLKNLEARLQANEVNQLGKKEVLQLTRERDKLELTLGGIKEMGGLPNILFVLDTNKEKIAVLEANKLDIPVVAIVDTNADPEGVNYPIPGNDDAMRAISLYCELAQSAILDGLEEEMKLSGKDIGEIDQMTETTIDKNNLLNNEDDKLSETKIEEDLGIKDELKIEQKVKAPKDSIKVGIKEKDNIKKSNVSNTKEKLETKKSESKTISKKEKIEKTNSDNLSKNKTKIKVKKEKTMNSAVKK